MADYEPPLTAAEREEILEIYENVRVADAADGLDCYGFGYDLNRMSSDIGPLYRDMESFDHRIVGFAHTVRYLPTNRRRGFPDELGHEETFEWRDGWYDELAGEPTDINDHDVIVLEAHGLQCGIIGSVNALEWIADGAVGIVTNGGPRDTDEMIKENIPTYSKTANKSIIPGRTEFDDSQIPVNVGGCQVRPEDVIVADGDGVVVVPLEFAKRVGEAARTERETDQAVRRDLYERVGLEPDFTLE
ncbi:RraA family protein [Halosimplex amylolyticum]|uniref:RraA family protein n=1 Tax=Halosimplex amylolyticum TaxID=3396616 RepID=UPI003F565583